MSSQSRPSESVFVRLGRALSDHKISSYEVIIVESDDQISVLPALMNDIAVSRLTRRLLKVRHYMYEDYPALSVTRSGFPVLTISLPLPSSDDVDYRFEYDSLLSSYGVSSDENRSS